MNAEPLLLLVCYLMLNGTGYAKLQPIRTPLKKIKKKPGKWLDFPGNLVKGQ